ncbi:MAG: T9SS type A sorting domain-containing protein [Salinibacter sp.]|uniref:T9SS type A sorting domain-containing protein n=1 Tax=Salinibacter sp. TaxID=2065818 RepID=UPI002FC2B17B
MDDCCRIGDLTRKNNQGFNVEATIDTENLGTTTSSGPFVGVSQGTNVTYQIPSTNPDNDQLRFRLATPSEMGASSSNPPNLSINSTTGEITWDNSGEAQGSLHALQVIIEEYDQGVDPANNDPKATVPSDFMFKITGVGNDQPVCELDPSSTTVSSGTPVSIDVTGSDPTGDADDDDQDGNTVRISSTSLPGGSLNPNPQVGPSPQTATFDWTPNSTGTFNAQFSVGDGLTTTLCTATIDVVQQKTCADGVPTLGQDDIDKQNGTLKNTISDGDGVEKFTFSTLDGFEVGSISPSSGFDRSGNTWTWTGSGEPPTSVDFTLEATQSTATYFLEATDACDDPEPNTTTFDPTYELGPGVSQPTLAGNAPNPFGERTTVEFALPEQARVTVAVYDMMGRKVATLVDGVKGVGTHTLRWNGESDRGQALSSGVYLLRMRADGQSETRRMTIVR